MTIPAIPKPIQRAVLPAAIRGQRDVVGAAETGSGKTLAFAIPILNGILEYNRQKEEENAEEQGQSEDKGDVTEEEKETEEGANGNSDDGAKDEEESAEEEDFSDPGPDTNSFLLCFAISHISYNKSISYGQ